MSIELKIQWHGNVPGLEEHRLSLAHFGEPLHYLLLALRRIATQMVSAATEGEQPQTGRFANMARQLDIELMDIQGASSGFNAVLAFREPADMLPLFADLPDRASIELLTAIEHESKEQPYNASVRRYLRSLPDGISKQEYIVHEGGKERRKLELGDIKLTEIPAELPFVRQSLGSVVGVGFEPGKNEVRIKADASTIALATTQEFVDRAWEIRKEPVKTISVHDGKHARLVSLKRTTDPQFKLTDESIDEHIFKRWSGVLARLAK